MCQGHSEMEEDGTLLGPARAHNQTQHREVSWVLCLFLCCLDGCSYMNTVVAKGSRVNPTSETFPFRDLSKVTYSLHASFSSSVK